MHSIDIATLLRDALILSGCTAEQIGRFDGHSTIELEFTGLPKVNLAMLESGVWLWSPTVPLTPTLRQQRGSALFEFLLQGFAAARTEQLQLNEVDGVLELRVLLGDAAVADAAAFTAAIEAYVERLESLQEALR